MQRLQFLVAAMCKISISINKISMIRLAGQAKIPHSKGPIVICNNAPVTNNPTTIAVPSFSV